MKSRSIPTSLHALLALACSVPLLRADEQTDDGASSTAAPTPTSGFTFPEEFIDGTPPPPVPPKPRLQIAEEDMLATRAQALGERGITFHKVAPIELPPLPEPVAPSEPQAQQMTGEIGEAKETSMCFIGATVYRSSEFPGESRTLLRVWNQRTGKFFEAWSTAPWNQLAGAFTTFDGPGNRQYVLMMSWHEVDIDRLRENLAQQGQEFQEPDIPDFPEGDRSSFVLIPGEENPPAGDLSPLQAIHDLCKDPVQLARLQSAWEGRMAAKAAAEARALTETPSDKKNIVVRYWRLDDAGQAGAQPKPADIR